MRIFKHNIVQFFIAAVFSVALMLPSVVQFTHSFDDHKHEVCTDVSAHIHQKQLDCSIYDFHFSIFNFSPQELHKLVIIHVFETTQTIYFLPKIEEKSLTYLLRGPPLLS